MGGRTVTKTFFHGKSTLPPPRHQVNSCPSQSNCSSFPHPRWREDCCTRMNFVCLPLSKTKWQDSLFFCLLPLPTRFVRTPSPTTFFPRHIFVSLVGPPTPKKIIQAITGVHRWNSPSPPPVYIDPDKGWVTLNSVGLEPGEGEGEAGHCTAPPPPTIPVYRQWKEGGGNTVISSANYPPPSRRFGLRQKLAYNVRSTTSTHSSFFSVTHPPCENYRGRLTFHRAFFCNPTTSLLVLLFFCRLDQICFCRRAFSYFLV